MSQSIKTKKHKPAPARITSSIKADLENWFRTTLYSIGDGVITTDIEGRILQMNPTAEKLTGWKEKEAKGKTISKVFHIINGKTRKRVTNPVKRILNKGIVICLADYTVLLSRNGSEYILADAGAPILDHKGKILGTVIVFRDQTAQIKAQQEIKEAKEFAENIVNTIHDPLLVLDKNLNVVSANRSFYNLFKVTPKETIGFKIYELGNGQWNIMALRKLLEEILPSKKFFEGFEVTNNFEKIGKRTMVLNASKLFGNSDKSQLILLSILDITEKINVEAKLIESEERFRKISEVISDFAYQFRVNPDLTLQGEWLNEQFTKTFGFTSEEIDARSGWQSMVYPEDLPIAQQHALKVANGNSDIVEMRFVTRDGQVRWIRDYAIPIWDEKAKRVTRIYGAAQDITEYKKAEQEIREREERFTRLAESTATAIFIYQNDKFVYANRACEELSGYKKDELVNMNFWDVVHPDFVELVKQRGLTRQKGENVPPRYEFKIVRKDGTERWIDFTGGKIDWMGKPAAIGTAFDVTERKQAEDKIYEDEERYRFLSEMMYDYAYSFKVNQDKSIQREWIIGSFEKITGYKPEEMESIGGWRTLIHPDDIPVAQTRFEKLLKGEYDVSEFRIIRKDGGIRWLRDHGKPIFDNKENRVIRIIGAAEDITERRQTEQALRDSEERYRIISEMISDFAYSFKINPDKSIKEEWIIGNVERITGYPLSKILTTKDWQIFIHPDDRNIFQSHIQKMINGEPDEIEYRIMRKDGTIKWLKFVTKPIYDEKEGRVIRVLGAGEDITERKQAEEYIIHTRENYERFFTEDLTGDFVCTIDGIISSCNPAFLRILGLSSLEEATSSNIFNFMKNTGERDRLISRLQRERKLEYIELEMIKKDNSPVYLVANILGVFDKNDRLIEIRGYLFDDTKRKLLEEGLRQTQKLETLGTLASGIAHDFNNILGIILGHSTILERIENLQENYKNNLKAIQQATHRGASLVKQLLTFARKAESVFEPVNINSLIKDLSKMLNETLPKTIDIELQLDENLPELIADPTQIHQVVLNLCLNSRDAMPKGGKLLLCTKQISGEELCKKFPGAIEKMYVVITVQDTGFGMDEITKSRIFEPFFTTKPQGQGTGLGLSVVHGIVNAHNGFIEVQSEAGKGTTFHVYLPIKESVPISTQILEAKISEIPGGCETVLVIEDEQLLRDLLNNLLSSKGYKVLLAEDGAQALQIYSQHKNEIALVLCDMGLPRISGEDIFYRIKTINPCLKFILASGFIEPHKKSELFKSGLKDFLQKPYTPEDVLIRVRKVLDIGA